MQVAVQMVDADGSGTISYDEFVRWWREGDHRFKMLQLDEAQLQRRKHAAVIFSHFDKDRSGTIDKGEFAGLYQLLVQHGLTRRTEAVCLQELDANGDGSLSLPEFVDWLNSGQH